MEIVFSVGQLQEKCRETQIPLHMTFIDLRKAFDSVNIEGLYTVLGELGCPRRLLNLIRSLHTGMVATVVYDNEESEAFAINNGVSQGCFPAPVLFNIYFSYVMRNAFQGNDEGVYLKTRYDGRLCNISRLRSKTEVKESIVRELLFANDAVLVAHSGESLQTLLDRFAQSCRSFGLEMSWKKTVTMHQGSPSLNSEINVDCSNLDSVDKFCYLGFALTRNLDLNDEIAKRIGKGGDEFWATKETSMGK